MEYKKRDCPIEFEICPTWIGGWQSCRFKIENDSHSFGISYALGGMFFRLADIAYGLNVEVNDPSTDRSIIYLTDDPTDISLITGVEAHASWDGEGPTMEWSFVRQLYNNDEQYVDITIDCDAGEKVFRYKVKLADLNYALAKALTQVIKNSGFCGYHFASIDDDIDINRFIALKHLALTGEPIEFRKDSNQAISSSFDEEMELIAFDM